MSSSSSRSRRVRLVILFLNPQGEVGPSISSSVVLCSFVLLVYIAMLVLVFCLCPSSVRVVATFSGTVLFPLLHVCLIKLRCMLSNIVLFCDDFICDSFTWHVFEPRHQLSILTNVVGVFAVYKNSEDLNIVFQAYLIICLYI
jgi:hypothetical protein